MKEWLAGLEQRERLLVYAAAGLLAVILVYAIFIQPFHSGHGKLKATVEAQRETVSWMQQSAAKVKQLKSAGPAAGKGLGGRSLLSVADTAARGAGLGPALKRIEPEGRSGVRVWLEGASFDAVVGWLNVMSTQYGVEVDSATLERAGAPGRVNVRLNLQVATPS